MKQSFEVLPFDLQPARQGEAEQEWAGESEDEWEGEWQGERTRPSGGGAMRARAPLRGPRRPVPSRYQPRRAPRQPAPALPHLPPRYRGWGAYPVPYSVPWPAPWPAPQPNGDAQADQGQDDWQDDGQDDGQAEMPPQLADTLRRLPIAASLKYQHLGKIHEAVKHPAATGAGMYVIEFDTRTGRRAYSGQTHDLRKRLIQHRLCGTMMGIDMGGHEVYVAQLAARDPRRLIEKTIHDDMFARDKGVLTNQRRELEMEVLGELWS